MNLQAAFQGTGFSWHRSSAQKSGDARKDKAQVGCVGGNNVGEHICFGMNSITIL